MVVLSYALFNVIKLLELHLVDNILGVYMINTIKI